MTNFHNFDKIQKIVLLLVILFLTSCKKEVVISNLSESQANKVIVALMNKNIEVEKVATQTNSFNVVTSTEDFKKAYQLLADYGYDKLQHNEEGVLETGIFSNNQEKEFAHELQLAKILTHSLESLPNVLLARVHIKTNKLKQTKNSVSASVLLLAENLEEINKAEIERFIAVALGTDIKALNLNIIPIGHHQKQNKELATTISKSNESFINLLSMYQCIKLLLSIGAFFFVVKFSQRKLLKKKSPLVWSNFS
jgi:type III secretory pathway lipoprotein EscJ